MPPNVFTVYKNSGETPLECLMRVKKSDPKYTHLPMTYAGRLDPMAEGLLLLLVGDECQKKDEYLALQKEYEVTILFGFATDTYDLLGLVEKGEKSNTAMNIINTNAHAFLKDNPNILQKFSGKINQKYPSYSSRTVDGKPLFQWARAGKLSEITIPTHEVYINDIKILKSGSLRDDKLLEIIKNEISKVSGDFRQSEIVEKWEGVLNEFKGTEFETITISVSCSSGTYVRSIAHELGQAIGIPALAMKIIRTKIGDFRI